MGAYIIESLKKKEKGAIIALLTAVDMVSLIPSGSRQVIPKL